MGGPFILGFIAWYNIISFEKGHAYGGSGVSTQNREKKIKPIKQPVKLQRPPTLLDKVARIDESLGRNEREKAGRIAPAMAQSSGE